MQVCRTQAFGPKARDLSLVISEALCGNGRWGGGEAHLRSPCQGDWAGAWAHLPVGGPGVLCRAALSWVPRDRSRRGSVKSPGWHGSQRQLQGKQGRSAGRPGSRDPGTSAHVRAERVARRAWPGRGRAMGEAPRTSIRGKCW